MQQIIPAEFHGTSLSIIDRDGQKWLTAEEVGRCLGYDASNARKGVMKLYERHGDEFSEADTCVVNLTTQGQGRAMRIFSSEGCVMLGMFANTPRAKDFRQWAKRVLAGQPAPAAPMPAVDLSLAREVGLLRDQLQTQTTMLLGLYQQLDGARRGHLRAQASLLMVAKRQATSDAKALVLALLAQGVARDEIARRTGKTLNHIRQIAFHARHDGQGELPLGEAA